MDYHKEHVCQDCLRECVSCDATICEFDIEFDNWKAVIDNGGTSYQCPDHDAETAPAKCHKPCSCGKLHTEIPESARFASEEEYGLNAGWYWECSCKSTLYVHRGPLEPNRLVYGI